MQINKTIEQFQEDRFQEYLKSSFEGQIFDNVEYEFLKRIFKIYNFELFIDIGANDGNCIDIALQCGKIPYIIAFEPDERNYKKLKEKYRETFFFYMFNIALYKHNFWKRLYYINDGTQSSLKFKFQNKYKWIRTKTLDSFYKNINKNKSVFIKIDAEGCEPEILQGMKKIISDYKGNIVLMIEYSHKWLLSDKEKYKLFFNLMNNDFTIYRLNSFGLEKIADNIVYRLNKTHYACLVAFKRIKFDVSELIYNECGLSEFIPIFNNVNMQSEEK